MKKVTTRPATADVLAPVVVAEVSERELLTLKDKILDSGPYMGTMLRAAGYSLIDTPNGTHVQDLPCPKCGGTHHTLRGTPALKFLGGSYGNGYQDQHCRLVCQLCSARTTASQLGAVLWPDQKGRKGGRSKFYDQHLPVTRLRPQRFVAVRYKKELIAVGGNFTVLAQSVAGKTFDPSCDIEALLIWAVAKDVADAAAAKEGQPWAVVPCTAQLQPLAAWHGQPMTVSEEAALWRVQEVQRRQRDAKIDTALRAERQRLIEETPLA